MMSDWRGDARKMIPSRSWSYRGVERCIISTAQHASPNVIGQNDPCRAQFVMMSSVVSAYWITPFVGSWLGSSTSLRGIPATPVEELPCGVRDDVASFFEVVDMEAADWKGTMVVGLAAAVVEAGRVSIADCLPSSCPTIFLLSTVFYGSRYLNREKKQKDYPPLRAIEVARLEEAASILPAVILGGAFEKFVGVRDAAGLNSVVPYV